MKDIDFFRFLLSEAQTPFSGWDFPRISKTGRMVSEPLSWSMTSELLMKIHQVQSMLDMGTGGGEYLSSLSPLPPETQATEGFAPNVDLAKNRLNPLGIKVSEIDKDEELPFEDETFELVMKRHESFSAQEVFRITRSGGWFMTQQVGGTDNLKLNEYLCAKADFGYSEWNLKSAVCQLEEAGFQIEKQEQVFPTTRFFDVGAVIYYLKAISWQIPDFSIHSYFERLKAMHEVIEKKGFFEVISERFLIIAQK